jgi:hypothetical protein
MAGMAAAQLSLTENHGEPRRTTATTVKQAPLDLVLAYAGLELQRTGLPR